MTAWQIHPQHWPAWSALLDQWLDLPAGARGAWLDNLGPEYAGVLPFFRRLLESQPDGLSREFLETLPKLAPGFQPGVDPSITPGTLVGPYRVLRELGSGGMGVVWLAERADGLLKRQVALKLHHASSFDHSLADRFAREGQILAQLVHPNIARLYDAGTSANGQPYLALEYVDGEPVTVYAARRRLPLERRLLLFVDILRAVQYAHANLIVHRDLKPANILVTQPGEIRLLDFGIAKLLTGGEAGETELTRLGEKPLTPDYASPEQVSGDKVTTASDIYSLGVLLFQLLSEERPYKLKRGARAGLLEEILAIEYVPPSRRARESGNLPLARALKGDLDTIVLKALQKQPEARYATADAFAQDIERYLKGEPVLARPESAWYRAGKFVRRNKASVSASAAVLLSVTLAFGIALYEAGVARQKTQTAEAVQKFLLDIFRENSSESGDPLRARQTNAMQLLDIGARNIDRELAGAPEAKLELLTTFGTLFTDLGLNDRAVANARKAVDLARATYGSNSAEAASALVSLGLKITESSSNDEEAVLREAEKILDRNRDFTSLTRAGLYQALGIHYVSKDVSKSIWFSEKAIGIYRKEPPSEPLVNTLNFLGQAQNTRKDFRQAAAAFSEAIESAQASKIPMHGIMPALYSYLGEVRFQLMDIGGAEQSYRLGLEAARRFRGEDHEDIIQTKRRLGAFLFETGRPQAGLALLDQASQLAQRTKGPGDAFHTAQALTAYGSRLAAYGQTEAGLALLSQATEIRRRAKRTGGRAYARGQELMALAEIELGHYPSAESLLDQASAVHARIGDTAESGMLDSALLARIELLLARRNAAEAAKVIRAIRPPASDGQISVAWLDYSMAAGKVELAQARNQEASARMAAVRRLLQASALRGYLKNYEAQAALVEGTALRSLDRSADALPLLERAVQLDSEIYDPGHSTALAQAHIALAGCLADLGHLQRARTLLAKAQAVHATHRECGSHLTTPLRRLEARLRS
jgi:serine/threonine-protein kinase